MPLLDLMIKSTDIGAYAYKNVTFGNDDGEDVINENSTISNFQALCKDTNLTPQDKISLIRSAISANKMIFEDDIDSNLPAKILSYKDLITEHVVDPDINQNDRFYEFINEIFPITHNEVEKFHFTPLGFALMANADQDTIDICHDETRNLFNVINLIAIKDTAMEANLVIAEDNNGVLTIPPEVLDTVLDADNMYLFKDCPVIKKQLSDIKQLSGITQDLVHKEALQEFLGFDDAIIKKITSFIPKKPKVSQEALEQTYKNIFIKAELEETMQLSKAHKPLSEHIAIDQQTQARQKIFSNVADDIFKKLTDDEKSSLINGQIKPKILELRKTALATRFRTHDIVKTAVANVKEQCMTAITLLSLHKRSSDRIAQTQTTHNPSKKSRLTI